MESGSGFGSSSAGPDFESSRWTFLYDADTEPDSFTEDPESYVDDGYQLPRRSQPKPRAASRSSADPGASTLESGFRLRGEKIRPPLISPAAHYSSFPAGTVSASRNAKRQPAMGRKELPVEELMALEAIKTQIGNRSATALNPISEDASLESGRIPGDADNPQAPLSAAAVRARRRRKSERLRPNRSLWNRVQNAFHAAASRVVDTHVNFTQHAFTEANTGEDLVQDEPPFIHARDGVLAAEGRPRQQDHKRQRSRSYFGPEELKRTMSHQSLLTPENASGTFDISHEYANAAVKGTKVENLQASPSIARELRGKSYFVFGPENAFRTWCTTLLMHRWTEPFLFLVIIFQWIVYLMAGYGNHDQDLGGFHEWESRKGVFGDTWGDWALLCVFVIYTIEAVARSVVFGFVINPTPDCLSRSAGSQISDVSETRRELGNLSLFSILTRIRDAFKSRRLRYGRQPKHLAYLRHTFTRLDFCCVVAFWVDFYIMLLAGHGSNVLKSIAATRPARLLLLTEGLATILHSLKMSAPLLLNVSGFIMFFFLLFGIFGVQGLRGSVSRRCVYLNETDPGKSQIVAPARACGGYYTDAARTIANGEYRPALVTDALLGAKGYICDYGQYCMSMQIPPDHLGTFDNIIVSLMTVFTVVTMENWSFLSYSVMDAENNWSALYFCVIVLTMSFVMIQMFLAVITETFSKVRDETKHSAFSEKEEVRILTEISEDGTWDIRDVSGNKLSEDDDNADSLSFLLRAKRFFFAPPSSRPDVGHGRQGSPGGDRRKLPHIIRRNRIVWAAHDLLTGVVTSKAFRWTATLVVAASLLTQALKTSTDDWEHRAALDACEKVYTLYLAVEVVMRLAAILRLRSWRRLLEKWNDRVDLSLAIATCIMLIPSVKALPHYRYWTVFQVMRAYRLVKVVPTVDRLMSTVLGSFISLANVTLFMTMSFLVIAPVCTELLGGDFDQPTVTAQMEGLPRDIRLSFDDLPLSLLSLYYILIGDNWWDLLYDAIRSQEPYGYFSVVTAAVVIIVTYCFMHYIILSLLVAVVLENFEIDEDQKQLMQLRKFLKSEQSYGRNNIENSALLKLNPYLYFKSKPRRVTVNTLPPDLVSNIRQTSFQQFMNEETAAHKTPGKPSATLPSFWRRIIAAFAPYTERPRKYMQKISANRKQAVQRSRPRDQIAGNVMYGSGANMWQINPEVANTQQEHDTAEAEFIETHPEYARALCFFWPTNRIRKLCQRITGSNAESDPNAINYFNLLVFAAICGSVVLTVYDSPMRTHDRFVATGSSSSSVVTILNIVFLGIFTIEFLIKVIAEGFLFTVHGYLRDPWNCLDFIVLVTYYVSEIPAVLSSGDARASRFFRATKALRPLRLINYLKGVREIFRITMLGLPRILDVAIFSVMLIVPFAVYGMNVFSGYYSRCNDDGRNMSECAGEYYRPLNVESNITAIYAPRVFSNPGYSFDSMGEAILTIFEMASTEGWADAMFAGMSVPSEIGGAAEFRRASPQWYNVIFFTVMMFFCSVLIIQLFIGVIVANFVTRSGQALLTADQRRWIDLQRQLKLVKPSRRPARPANRIRAWCYDLAIDKRGWHYTFVTLTICVNIAVMATENQSQTSWQQGASGSSLQTAADRRTQYKAVFDVRDIAYTACIGIYVFDVFVKFFGLGWQKWRSSRWNIYDAVVTFIATVAITIRGIIYSALITKWSDATHAYTLLGSSGWLFEIQKIALMGIGLRIVQRIDTLQTLFRAILNALPSVANIAVVFILVLLFYAIIFIEVFGLVRLGANTGPHANVWDLDKSLFLMVRMTTGEAWSLVMQDFMIDRPNCVANEENYLLSDCGGRLWAYILFISFYVICTYIFLNMFIVVVIDNFSFAYQEDAAFSLIKREDLRSFKRTWASFDPKATGYIQAANLHQFLGELRGRFDVCIYRDDFRVNNLKEMILSAAGVAQQHQQQQHLPRGSTELPRWHLERSRSVIYSQALLMTPLTTETYKPLVAKLAELNVELIRQRKRWLNLVYYDALSLAVDGKGIPFRDMLQVLSFKLVDVERSLKVDDLIKRQEKISELEEKIAVERVRGIFRTIHERRIYLRTLKEMKQPGTATRVPSIMIDKDELNEPSSSGLDRAQSPVLSHKSSSSLGTSTSVLLACGYPDVNGHEESENSAVCPPLHLADAAPLVDNTWLGLLRESREDSVADGV